MVTIFVARGEDGASRFIGEVARGHACACSCLVCGSPLVAKQGEELEWHFAHEAGQERPECPAGAFNLLRRLAVSEMIARSTWVEHPYRVKNPLLGAAPLEWTAQQAGPLVEAEADGAHQPAAWASLEGGMLAGVFVCIGNETPPSRPDPSGPAAAQAQLILNVASPEGTSIRTEEDARRFLRKSMQLRWGFLPDWRGLLAEAMARARVDAQRWQAEQAAAQAGNAKLAGERWAATRRAMQSRPDAPHAHADAITVASNGFLNARNGSSAVPEWAPGLMPGGGIQYRELDDGSRWVCYSTPSKEQRLAPVPATFEGWDECFPPSIASPGGPGWLLVHDYGRLLLLLRNHTRASRITSDVEEIRSEFMRPASE